MRMLDVHVLIYAHRADSHADHSAFAACLTKLATSAEPFALSPAALQGLFKRR